MPPPKLVNRRYEPSLPMIVKRVMRAIYREISLYTYVLTFAGECHRVKNLTKETSFAGFYQEVRRVLHIEPRASNISLVLAFNYTLRSDRPFEKGELLHGRSNWLCLCRVRGCFFDAILHF